MIGEIDKVIDFVKHNQPVSAQQVSEATGLHKLTVHRHLNGGRGKMTNGIFIREKATKKVVHPGGRIRGAFHYVYFINPSIQPIPRMKPKQVVIKRDPITAALFGSVMIAAIK
ncbi:hypothetical protein [Polynucleobacter sp. AP-RePozz3-80-G7]|uniref:hypothetical protein n=1 Tax=Polynucleobacter sp. AP-RePozz3-80-G7 TaxID=2689105 RepID=UPI001C0B2F99|nr:hypothetical protein [Polynucleobacter sp. AP-RePozz3-80-G7]MBU3639988.1 hypothetical protein [Polynucleobacter sp. AP-RePozz3-80-G7]